MGVETTIEINGLGDALKGINRMDRALRKQLNKDFADAARPMLTRALGGVPSQPPLSGWARKWKGSPLWTSKDTKAIELKIDTRSQRRRNEKFGAPQLAVLKMRTKTRGVNIYDMAGRGETKNPKGQQMIRSLREKSGKEASRTMWPSAEATQSLVENNLRPVIDKVMTEYNRLMAGR